MRNIAILRGLIPKYNIAILRGLIPKYNKGMWAPRDPKRWLQMVDTGTGGKTVGMVTYPCVVEFIPDSEDFQVSILRQNNADINSYVESRIRSTDPIYNSLKQKVSILSVSGDNEDIEGIGIRYTDTFFTVLLNKDEHDEILK